MVIIITLKKDYLVVKRNILNEIRASNMKLQELRFFAIYLCKINPEKPDETRIVRFPIDDFKTIMEFSSKIKIDYMKNITNSLLQKVVNVPNERGGYVGFQLFKECRVDKDKNSEWYVEIDAHDKALPLISQFKKDYFSYPIFNALRLKSANQIRMYELLKQYEYIGYRIYSIEELKKDLWLEEGEYSRFGDFKTYVLNTCQKTLKEYTDIKFTYNSHGKKGAGGKIINLIFYIEKNKNCEKQISLEKFIDNQKSPPPASKNNYKIEEEMISPYQERINFFMGACNDEFTYNQIMTLDDKMREFLSDINFNNQITCFHYIKSRYNEMIRQSKKREISNRFGYVKSLIGKII